MCHAFINLLFSFLKGTKSAHLPPHGRPNQQEERENKNKTLERENQRKSVNFQGN
ncbi:Uncharacterized protein TCM_040607 [Theobroma cacao]|uniref:Uncharacterized protein n=1 Tax=Theobroma cacao TaxID=3641 RepID=A0A061GRX9_THECC|nr:Uncharacterized protein TCM_040607 [Theobroma cacao]